MNHPTVYLAGHISGITYDEATEWRHRAAEQLRRDNAVVSLDPMRGKACLRAHYGDHPLPRLSGDEYRDIPGADEARLHPDAVAMRDHQDVRAGDVVLANLSMVNKRSTGTIVEMALAHGLGKPVCAVIGHEDDPNAAHPLVSECIMAEFGGAHLVPAVSWCARMAQCIVRHRREDAELAHKGMRKDRTTGELYRADQQVHVGQMVVPVTDPPECMEDAVGLVLDGLRNGMRGDHVTGLLNGIEVSGALTLVTQHDLVRVLGTLRGELGARVSEHDDTMSEGGWTAVAEHAVLGLLLSRGWFDLPMRDELPPVRYDPQKGVHGLR